MLQIAKIFICILVILIEIVVYRSLWLKKFVSNKSRNFILCLKIFLRITMLILVYILFIMIISVLYSKTMSNFL